MDKINRESGWGGLRREVMYLTVEQQALYKMHIEWKIPLDKSSLLRASALA